MPKPKHFALTDLQRSQLDRHLDRDWERLRRYCVKLARHDNAYAEDLLAYSLLRIAVAFDNYNPRYAFITWAGHVVSTSHANIYRNHERNWSRTDFPGDEALELMEKYALNPPSPSAESEYRANSIDPDIQHAIDCLGPRERIRILDRLDGKSQAQTAADLNTSTASVSRIEQTALAKLRSICAAINLVEQHQQLITA